MRRGVLFISLLVFCANAFCQQSSLDSAKGIEDTLALKHENLVSPKPVLDGPAADYDRIIRYSDEELVVTIKIEVSNK